jgi:hypothetical protein
MPEMQHKPQKPSPVPLLTFLAVILAAILFMVWAYLSGTLPWQPPPENGEPQVSWLVKEPETAETPETGAKEEAKLHLTPGEVSPSPAEPDECLQTADKILLFFEHLDGQNYVRDYGLNEATIDHFTGIINKLIANPPVVVRETDDLFAILKNMAHFFRVLGPRDILLIKDVLMHERELIEPTMALFYRWSKIVGRCDNKDIKIELPLAGLYEYAGYFLHTLGGQSYLFRRELFFRTLIRYYSILVIDRANSVDANRYGIDIRYTLDALIEEIQGNSFLENRKEYLENLIRLQEAYQAQYGSRNADHTMQAQAMLSGAPL